MVWKCLIYLILFNFFPVFSKEVPRSAGSDEVGEKTCDAGWHRFRQKCYKLGGETDEGKKTWQEAENICTTFGGHLVSINSKEEVDFLVNNIIRPLKFDAWIGLHDRHLESIFTWQDGSPINYTNFMAGEPNHASPEEDCIRMIYNNRRTDDVIGQWRDTVCSKNHSYICQKKIVNTNEASMTTGSDTVGDIACDVGWLHFREKCYKLEGEADKDKKTWEDAAIICTTFGGHLVSINSQDELDFLVNNIIRPLMFDAWIGLNDQDSESIFTWLDGSPVNYTNYMIGEPNHRFPDEDCIRMIYKDIYTRRSTIEVIGQWRDTICSDRYPYICQKRKFSPPLTDKTENTPSSTPMNPNEVSRMTGSGKVDDITCDAGWLHFRQKCYKLGGETEEAKKTWEKAASICTALGGHLVSINSPEELDFLVNRIIMPFKDAAWIGLHDRDSESNFSWLDGSPLNYTNYMAGEPNHRFPDEDCIRMIYKDRYSWQQTIEVMGQWRDTICSENYSYICQKEIVTPTVTPAVTDKSGSMPSSTPDQSAIMPLIGIIIVLALVLLGVVICYLRPWKKCSRRRGGDDTQPIQYRVSYK